MADDPKIVPSPPPSEPVDVRVSPSPAPAEPFDVPTYPSPPPSEPFDVKVFPDPPPGGTHDVPTAPDGPPVEPYDVPLLPDGPPLEPYDVPLLPDGPPLEPFDVPLNPDPAPGSPIDVPTVPDGPPVEPVDVQTQPDGPPIEPYDVATTPDGPPNEPFDVPTTPDGPPIAPFDVGVMLSPPPAEPVDIRDHRHLGVPPLEYPFSPQPTTRELVNALKDIDSRLSLYIQNLDENASIGIAGSGGGAMDPTILAAWFRDYLSVVGPVGVAKFIAEQGALYAMNPVTARVFNPAYFIAMLIPGSMGHIHTTLDTQAGLTAAAVALAKDELIQIEARLPDLDHGPGPNVYDSRRGHTFNDGQDFNVDEMVEAALENRPHPFTKPEKFQSGLTSVQTFDASKYFDDRDELGGQTARRYAKSLPASVQSTHSKLAASNFLNGVVRVPISAQESPDGAVYSVTDNPGELVDDDDTRIPLCFTDLRKDPVQNAYRSVYFRPLNLNFSKAISPEWSEGTAFGRVDPIVGYTKTIRSYNVSFELHAFAPEDLQLMYHKMTWLDSMCYPSYGSDSLMRSGPVIRLRIGDAVSTDSGGLSGIIKSLNYDFSDALWELQKGMKVPRSFKVSLDFMALHEGPVGILNGAFGVFQLPTNGNKGDVDTTNPGGPSESREGTPRVATLLPGRFSKFGEPQR